MQTTIVERRVDASRPESVAGGEAVLAELETFGSERPLPTARLLGELVLVQLEMLADELEDALPPLATERPVVAAALERIRRCAAQLWSASGPCVCPRISAVMRVTESPARTGRGSGASSRWWWRSSAQPRGRRTGGWRRCWSSTRPVRLMRRWRRSGRRRSWPRSPGCWRCAHKGGRRGTLRAAQLLTRGACWPLLQDELGFGLEEEETAALRGMVDSVLGRSEAAIQIGTESAAVGRMFARQNAGAGANWRVVSPSPDGSEYILSMPAEVAAAGPENGGGGGGGDGELWELGVVAGLLPGRLGARGPPASQRVYATFNGVDGLRLAVRSAV